MALLFGVSLFGVLTIRFLIEVVKENQSDIEEGMLLIMGKPLTIPLIITGITMVIWALNRKKIRS